jgi:hypothetical protein
VSGTLHANGRIRMSDEARERIEARIPDGYDLAIQPTDAWWLFYPHVKDGGRVGGPLRVSRGMPVEQACLFALDKWAARGAA